MSGKERILSYIGQRTMPIYVLQGFCIAFSRILLTKAKLNDQFGIIPMIVCTVVAIAIPLTIYEVSCKVGKFDSFFHPGKYMLK